MKPEIPQQLFEIYSDIKGPKNPSSKSRVFSSGRKDRHEEANSRFSQFYELPYARYQLANQFQLTTYSTPNSPEKDPIRQLQNIPKETNTIRLVKRICYYNSNLKPFHSFFF